ncbi:retinol-binding protein pinta-like [Photinus pyralis]|uniref:retinol-binding protein pinta-like n=1 Tax=Photinus pyralis TaxID=7054 RepID=UPI0012678093|nr:retinol-binding protein pinta-like [Photinus pyralis]
MDYKNEMKCCKKEDLNEDRNRTEIDLETIRDWLKKQPHLNIREDDDSLLIFLRSSKYSLQRTKEKLETYYSTLTLLPEFFDNRDPFLPDIQALLNVGTMVPLPNPVGPSGSRILFVGYGYDPDVVTYTTIIKACHIFWEMFAKVPTPYSFLRVLSPPWKWLLQSLPKACLNGKLKERLHVYRSNGNFKEIHKEIPLEFFPKEYGGNNGSIEELGVIWKKKIESYSGWFPNGAKYKSNENLRLDKSKNAAREFGVDGSFRRLAID